MTIPVERLIEGMIATLRADVIPNLPEGFARGQSVGVIDILNGMRGRVEWTREPALESVLAKRALLEKIGALAPDPAEPLPETLSTAALVAERDRLDGLIGDALKVAFDGRQEQALALLKQHIHDEAAIAMKLTRKPLFAEIASGGNKRRREEAMAYHLDPRMPKPEQCVQRYMLAHWAKAQPEKIFGLFPDGTQWTYAEANRLAIRTANALRKLGVKQGERVLVWMPNSAECLRIWFGLNYLGAVFVPLNLAYRGSLLQHALNLSEARLGIVHADLHQRLGEVEKTALREIVVLGGEGRPVDGVELLPASVLDSIDDAPPMLEREIAPWDMQSIIFTSGTTGPSKGVLSSYVHLYNMAVAAPFLGPDDRYMVNLPMFHSGGVMPVTAMLIHGGSISMVDAFDTDQFWNIVRRTQITTTILLGVMGGFLLKKPPHPDDRNHTLKTCTYVPLNDTAPQFHERFGTEIHTHFNMTEISMPIVSEPNPTALGSAGRPRKGVDVRIVDENDCEVSPGVVGEMVVRTECPWATSHGYAGNPEATAAAWRNGWFHTGDGFRKDEQGNFFFVDRLKDAIRRRGENISSFEVESEVLAYPAIKEAAAVAVKSEIAEDEVMAVVAIRDGEAFDPAALIEFLRPRMPHFMIPRYVRVVAGLPRTPTAKIEKVKLRAEGITADTWDRDVAGIVVKREKIGREKRSA